MNNAMKNWSMNPTSIDIPRSKQTMRHSHKTTFNTGHLIPIYWREVQPGSTVKMNVSEITRMQTPIFPIMDNAFIDTMFFFVPNRLIWEHWEEFMGENKHGIWEQKIEYEVPQIEFNHDNTLGTGTTPAWIKGEKYYKYGVQAGSLADYLGIPIVDANTTTPSWRNTFEVNALPFRAYYKIYNDWWRDENLMYPIEYSTGDTKIIAQMGSEVAEDSNPLTPPKYVAKFHDYFTSALPQPQKHDDVMIPIGDYAPVIYSDKKGNFDSSPQTVQENLIGKQVGLTKGNPVDNTYFTTPGTENISMQAVKSNALVADLTTATGATINALRQAFAVQRFYEKQARGGTRYIEQLKSMFGVTSPDARLQRSEYLGGTRKPVNINQVVQTSATGDVTPQGNVSAYSLTTQNNELFTKSFVEHGILMGVQVIRCEHSYQDGLNKMWLRKNMFDYYNPTFANIGEMPIYNKELYVGTNKDDEVFGYQEPWAEYRYMNNHVSGEFRSKYHQTLDAWHFADNYDGLPKLSYSWILEYETGMNRNIAVADTQADQWMADIFFEETWTQCMPTYSIPGLIDHH